MEAATPETEKRTYEVTVGGMPLRLRSSHDEQTVNELITMVDSTISQAMNANNISFQNALVLSALHLAEELMLTKRAALDELGQIEDRAQKILTDLEASPVSQLRLDN